MVEDRRLTLRLDVDRGSARYALIQCAKIRSVGPAGHRSCFVQFRAIRRVVDNIVIDCALAAAVFGIVAVEQNIPVQSAARKGFGKAAHAIVDTGLDFGALIVVVPHRHSEERKLGGGTVVVSSIGKRLDKGLTAVLGNHRMIVIRHFSPAVIIVETLVADTRHGLSLVVAIIKRGSQSKIAGYPRSFEPMG